MKHRFTCFILSAGLSTLLGTAVVNAQDQKEKANIPFAFETSERTLTAGEYTVQETSSRGLLRLADSDGRAIYLASYLTDSGAAQNPRLVFHCYGKDRMLSQVWMDDGSGFAVAESATEKNLRHQLKITPTLVSLPLHR